MAFRVVMVSGPRRSGKTTLITAITREVCEHNPHYVRLAAVDGTKKAPCAAGRCSADCGVATATWVDYQPDRAFEVIFETLTAVQRRDREACVLMEADVDSNLRHAYPYDRRIFVMAAPEKVSQVFRSPSEIRKALHSVLNDTTEFAREIYGLCGDREASRDERHETRGVLDDSQVLGLMDSPLGRDVAARVQFQPDYHGLIDADVVVVNVGVGGVDPAVDEVVRRVEKVVDSLPVGNRPRPAVFCCDAAERGDPRRQSLFDHLRNWYGAGE